MNDGEAFVEWQLARDKITQRRACLILTFFTANPTRTFLEANPAFREEKSTWHAERRNGHLSIVTTQQAGRLGIQGSIPSGGRDAFSRHWVQTGSGARPALWSIFNANGKMLQRVKLSTGLFVPRLRKTAAAPLHYSSFLEWCLIT